MRLSIFSFDSKSTIMKRIFVAGLALLIYCSGNAQQKEGKVIYQRTSQMQARSFNINGMTQEIPASTRTDKFELSFGNNQSLWKQAEQESEPESSFGGEGSGFQMRMVIAGSNDLVYHNFDAARRILHRSEQGA